jgi:hypothetical protein
MEELNMDIGDTRAIFKAGRCGLLIDGAIRHPAA